MSSGQVLVTCCVCARGATGNMDKTAEKGFSPLWLSHLVGESDTRVDDPDQCRWR